MTSDMTIRVERPHPPMAVWQTGITLPGNGGASNSQATRKQPFLLPQDTTQGRQKKNFTLLPNFKSQ
jgi:hypothetical protein